MRDEEIQEVIGACRVVAKTMGIEIPPIVIDRSELAQAISSSGIATLSNEQSLKHAQHFARVRKEQVPNWELGKVMCISERVIKAKPNDLFVLGVIMHEMGHAFNIAAKLKNTEANAQVFEIRTLLAYRANNIHHIPGYHAYTDVDLDDYFKDRMKPGYFCGSNTPITAGYVELHETLRQLPKVFKKSHEAYIQEFASFSTSQKRNLQLNLTIQIIGQETLVGDEKKMARSKAEPRFLSLEKLKLTASEENLPLDASPRS